MEHCGPLGLVAMNHISRVCSDVTASAQFYTQVLGFHPVSTRGVKASTRVHTRLGSDVSNVECTPPCSTGLQVKRPTSFEFEGAW